MYNRVRWAGVVVLVVMGSLLASCIQPDVTPTATFSQVPANPPVNVAPPTQPPEGATPVVSAPQVDIGLVVQLIAQRGDTPADLQVWYDAPLGSDRLQGFSYTNQNGVLCAGFLLVAFPNGVRQPQNDNGAKGCAAQPGQGALAGITVIVTSATQPFTVVVGRISDATVTAVAAEFGDGTNMSFSPINGGFLIVKPGIVQVPNVTAIDTFGNTVLTSVPLVTVG